MSVFPAHVLCILLVFNKVLWNLTASLLLKTVILHHHVHDINGEEVIS